MKRSPFKRQPGIFAIYWKNVRATIMGVFVSFILFKIVATQFDNSNLTRLATALICLALAALFIGTLFTIGNLMFSWGVTRRIFYYASGMLMFFKYGNYIHHLKFKRSFPYLGIGTTNVGYENYSDENLYKKLGMFSSDTSNIRASLLILGTMVLAGTCLTLLSTELIIRYLPQLAAGVIIIFIILALVFKKK